MCSVAGGPDSASSAPRAVGLGKEGWRAYLDSLVDGASARLAAVTLAQAGPLGDCERLRRPLQAIRYQAQADELEVVVGAGGHSALRYFISTPRSILIEELAGAKVLRVADATGQQTAIHLFDMCCEPSHVTPSLAGSVTTGSEPSRMS
jgi:hypothetical protein